MAAWTERWVSEGRPRSLALAFVAGTAVVATETAICSFALDHRLTDVVMVYLLGVVLVSMRFGYAPSLVHGGAQRRSRSTSSSSRRT